MRLIRITLASMLALSAVLMISPLASAKSKPPHKPTTHKPTSKPSQGPKKPCPPKPTSKPSA